MNIRAKFICNEISKRVGWGINQFLYSAKFNAVTDNNDENKTFYAATPSGSIEVSTVKEDHFKVGSSYYIDFTKAE